MAIVEQVSPEAQREILRNLREAFARGATDAELDALAAGLPVQFCLACTLREAIGVEALAQSDLNLSEAVREKGPEFLEQDDLPYGIKGAIKRHMPDDWVERVPLVVQLTRQLSRFTHLYLDGDSASEQTLAGKTLNRASALVEQLAASARHSQPILLIERHCEMLYLHCFAPDAAEEGEPVKPFSREEWEDDDQLDNSSAGDSILALNLLAGMMAAVETADDPQAYWDKSIKTFGERLWLDQVEEAERGRPLQSVLHGWFDDPFLPRLRTAAGLLGPMPLRRHFRVRLEALRRAVTLHEQTCLKAVLAIRGK